MTSKQFLVTDDERNVLTQLVTKHKNVIENKETDATSLNAKYQAWEKLTAEYNSQHRIRSRDAKQLKKVWGDHTTKR